MKRFIDVDAFLGEMKYVFNDMSPDVNLLTVKNRLETIDGADVVEVVRCKDCKRAVPLIFRGYYKCRRHSACRKADDYCSHGERKDAK